MEIRTQTIHGREAIAFLQKHREKYRSGGEYPFLIGDENELEMLEEMQEDIDQSVDDYLRKARRIKVASWFAKAEKNELADNEDFDKVELAGKWPKNSPPSDDLNLSLLRNLDGKFRAKLIVGFVRIDEPWHLPAAMKYGSWNACPSPEEHCALHRYWEAEYGAEIVCMSHDVIECFVSRPPQTRAAALKLAWEQYWYCNDIVDQGCDTISVLAASLLKCRRWFFWWD